MPAPTDVRAQCPNCHTWSEHRIIGVSDTITLVWCTRCQVPRVASETSKQQDIDRHFVANPPPFKPRRQWHWFRMV
jgi:hypothetical protein